MSNKIQNLNIDLQTIVKNIKNGNYLIPQFQRNFVWKKGDIEELGDSILKEYPISSMLLMPTDGNLKIGATQLKGLDYLNPSIVEEVKNNQEFYVLDGQQRTTSIASIFLGIDKKYTYYFDLLAILTQEFPDDNILDIEFKTNSGKIITFNNKLKNDIDYSFCFCTSFSKNNRINLNKGNYRYLPPITTIDGTYAEYVTRFLDGFKIEQIEQKYKYLNYLSNLLGTIKNYNIPITFIDKDAELEIVIRIFEKVNSTGKKLSLYDLINAKTSSSKNRGLTHHISNDISNYCKKNNIVIENTFKNFIKYNSEDDRIENLDVIVRIIEIAEYLSNNKKPTFTAKTMLQKKPDFWFEKWDKYKDTILDFIVNYEKEKKFKISNKTFLEYILAVIILLPKITNNKMFTEYIEKYNLYLIISKSDFSKSQLDIVMDIFNVANSLMEENLYKNIPQKYSILEKLPKMFFEISLKDISNNNYTNKIPLSIIYILYNSIHNVCCVDLFNTKINYLKSDAHHIFPKNTLSNTDKKNIHSIYNSIANITLLDSEHNRKNIVDTKFEKYMKDILNGVGDEEFLNILQQNLLPKSLIDDLKNDIEFTEEKQQAILTYRANKIKDIINTFFKNKK